ncbi:PREDICTED: ectonucleoside triphosphate diphosphohydrolase 5 [Nanorana parkeri]|uniref:ectonucleoside triphosphate diphosphohydrolase 5 n=1 Tax=Nanorana parkeri TaxID=125878 RepID=UPI0008544F73|nr:PREDICTED: ectonucleoside triphosphate diphosphohydrolase 5 [Nanorana parkeri]
MMCSWLPISALFFTLLLGFCPCGAEFAPDLKSVVSSTISSENRTIYGIVFDAGSTGTRIHIYTFHQRAGGSVLELDGEIFESVKPGLSSYANQPEKGADAVRSLLHLAQDAVPSSHWSKTPVILKATAGFRLLPVHQAEGLLSEVRKVFISSPFLVPEDSVTVLDGTDEGILAWIAVNFLTGRLDGDRSVGTLDLGGVSTQITFLPLTKATLDETPHESLASFELFNSTYRLYTHSYLGLGLKAARLAVLGASVSVVQQKQTFRSHCFPPTLDGSWAFSGVTYRYGGHSDGLAGFHLCYSEVRSIVEGKLHQADEIRRSPFYAFSYYYDRAVDGSLIDYDNGGVLEVRDFAEKAREVCDHMTSDSSHSHFLCMDLTFITALLREGFGFEDGTVLQLTKKVRDVEMSWTLGAAFHVLQSLSSE